MIFKNITFYFNQFIFLLLTIFQLKLAPAFVRDNNYYFYYEEANRFYDQPAPQFLSGRVSFDYQVKNSSENNGSNSEPYHLLRYDLGRHSFYLQILAKLLSEFFCFYLSYILCYCFRFILFVIIYSKDLKFSLLCYC